MEPNKVLQYETIQGQPIGKANHYQAVPGKDGERRIIKDDTLRAYEASFAEQCQLYRDRHISGPFVFHLRAYYQSNANDLDNTLKTILDCLQYAHAIDNDRDCITIHASKHIDPRRPRVEFAIEQLQPNLF